MGGNNSLPMKDLRGLLEKLDAENVKTYIQSGNAVFQHTTDDVDQLAERISAAIKESHGFAPRVLLLDVAAFETAAELNPFPEAEAEPKTLHLYFLAAPPQKPDLALLDSLKKDNEQYQLADNVFYLYAPDGIGRSKLAERVEKALGVAVTARNWRTVGKIMEMASEIG